MADKRWTSLSRHILYGDVMASKNISDRSNIMQDVLLHGGRKIPLRLSHQDMNDKDRSSLFERSSLMAVTSRYIPPAKIDADCNVIDRYNRHRWQSVRNMSIEKLFKRKDTEISSPMNKPRKKCGKIQKCYSFTNFMTIKDDLKGPAVNHIKV